MPGTPTDEQALAELNSASSQKSDEQALSELNTPMSVVKDTPQLPGSVSVTPTGGQVYQPEQMNMWTNIQNSLKGTPIQGPKSELEETAINQELSAPIANI